MSTIVPDKVITLTSDLATNVAAKVSGIGQGNGAPIDITSETNDSNVVADSLILFQQSIDQTLLVQTQIQANLAIFDTTKANIVSPTFTGEPQAPTPSSGANNQLLATTKFVKQAITDQLSSLGSIVPIGTISMWSGTYASIPAGWQACDGTNGTPDMRNKFVVGAGSTYNVGVTGGSTDAVVVSHAHAATSTSNSISSSSVSESPHSHSTTMYNIDDFNQGGAASPGVEQAPDNQQGSFTVGTSAQTTGLTVGTTTTTTTNTTVTANGVSGTNANLPPYYAVFYIMKMSNVVTIPVIAPLYVDTTNNRVGINVASPTVSFEVLGVSKLTGNTTITGNTQISSLGIGTAATGTAGEIRATNNITAYYSDDRMKTRLGTIEGALDKIDQLTGFYYEANDLAQSMGYKKVREVGVSAQDTQKVLSEVVAPAPIDDRYLTVRYEKFAPLLIEGIKELRVELNNIKQHLNI